MLLRMRILRELISLVVGDLIVGAGDFFGVADVVIGIGVAVGGWLVGGGGIVVVGIDFGNVGLATVRANSYYNS